MTQRTQIEVAKILMAVSTTISSSIDSDRSEFFGMVIPSSFEGTAITFQVSVDGINYQALYDTSNSAVSITVAAGRSYDLPVSLRAWPYFKLVSNAAVTSDRLIIVTMKG